MLSREEVISTRNVSDLHSGRGQLRIPAGPSAILTVSGGSLHTGQATVGVEP